MQCSAMRCDMCILNDYVGFAIVGWSYGIYVPPYPEAESLPPAYLPLLTSKF